jgi:hypothetical protein
MHARILPFRSGIGWLIEGFSLWKKSPAFITYLAFGYLLMLFVGSVIPVLGHILTALLMPIFSVGVLNGCKAVDEGKKPGPELLFSGFSSNIRGLAQVGALYFAGSVLVFLVVFAVDDGPASALLRGESGPVSPDAPPLNPSDLLPTLLLGVFVSMPVVMAYWFAPMLTAWHQVPALKSVFFSLVACWRNWRAFLGYSLAVLVFAGLLPGLLLGLLSTISGFLAGFLYLLVPIVLVPTLFASFYVNARDVFAPVALPVQAQDPIRLEKDDKPHEP